MSCLYCGQSGTRTRNGYCIKYSCESRKNEELASRERKRNEDFVEFEHRYRIRYHKTCFSNTDEFLRFKETEGKNIIYGKSIRDL